ncbi:MAG: thioredoxin domain-containing protein [Sphingobacterium sp.]|uniref:thioredoxin domain-containing protein n=1 Tax=Sphingobacterium sp. JB170 TaxID=1434842 RepID=UPI0015C61C1B|nr:thioredoxin domain-containing protein [Sphingobacterium sp. JB170]
MSLTLTLITSICFSQTQLGTAEFLNSLNSPNVVLLDVRTAKEFNGGTIANAKNIDWNNREAFESYINKLDKKQPIYLFCLSGGRSKKAAEYLAEQGFSVFELQGGYLKYQNEQKNVFKSTTDTKEGLTKANFQDLIKSNPKVLVDFTADWCAPCKLMRPYLDEIDRDNENGIKVVFIDADKNKKLLHLLDVSGIPRLQLFKNGKLVWDHTGGIERDELLQAIQDH